LLPLLRSVLLSPSGAVLFSVTLIRGLIRAKLTAILLPEEAEYQTLLDLLNEKWRRDHDKAAPVEAERKSEACRPMPSHRVATKLYQCTLLPVGEGAILYCIWCQGELTFHDGESQCADELYLEERPAYGSTAVASTE
jgi:hypothetical protein